MGVKNDRKYLKNEERMIQFSHTKEKRIYKEEEKIEEK